MRVYLEHNCDTWSENCQSCDWIYKWTYFYWASICHWMNTNFKCPKWNTNTVDCSPLWTLACCSMFYLWQQSWNHDAHRERHNYSASRTISERRTLQSSLWTGMHRNCILAWLLLEYLSRECSKSQKTCVLSSGRPRVMLRCDNDIYVKKDCVEITDISSVRCEFGNNVCQKTKIDEKIELSIDDRDFLEIIDSQFHKDYKNTEKPHYFCLNKCSGL